MPLAVSIEYTHDSIPGTNLPEMCFMTDITQIIKISCYSINNSHAGQYAITVKVNDDNSNGSSVGEQEVNYLFYLNVFAF